MALRALDRVPALPATEKANYTVRKARQYRGGYQFSGLKELARELRAEQTSAEALLWELIRNRRLLGFKFSRQHQFGDYVADFYCHESGISD